MLLTVEGAIFVYSISTETAVLLDSLRGNDILDSNDFRVNGVFSCVELFNCPPPVFDRFKSIIKETTRTNSVKPVETNKPKDGEYLAIGMHSGSMVVVSANNFRRVVYRN